jgi:hypothetical protein
MHINLIFMILMPVSTSANAEYTSLLTMGVGTNRTVPWKEPTDRDKANMAGSMPRFLCII